MRKLDSKEEVRKEKKVAKKKKKRSTSTSKNLKWFQWHKKSHFKKDCPNRKSKNNKDLKEKSSDAIITIKVQELDGYDLGSVLIATYSQTRGNCVICSSFFYFIYALIRAYSWTIKPVMVG